MDPITAVRSIVGRRSRISRDEMVAILMAMDLDPDASTIAGRSMDGALHVPVPDRWLPVGAPRVQEQRAIAEAWALACRGYTCVSVLRSQRGCDAWGVRYAGSMHPMQRAAVTFAAQAAVESLPYLRRHAHRVVVVR